MLVGHVAIGLLAKRATPTVSLGTLALAALLADLLWSMFLITGIEHVQFTRETGAAHYLHASDIGLSHSLLAIAIWGAILAAIYFVKSRYLNGALMLAGLAVSHCVLDWISHEPDMPLMPGGNLRFGLGLGIRYLRRSSSKAGCGLLQ